RCHLDGRKPPYPGSEELALGFQPRPDEVAPTRQQPRRVHAGLRLPRRDRDRVLPIRGNGHSNGVTLSIGLVHVPVRADCIYVVTGPAGASSSQISRPPPLATIPKNPAARVDSASLCSTSG